MKKHYIIITVLFAAISLALLPGCKYEVAEPEYPNSEFIEPQSKPKVNSIDPLAVIPGVNIITINGENLNLVPDERIYLEIPGPTVSLPDIIEKTATFITIRRPNLVTASCLVKLVPDTGLVVRSETFKIDPVLEQYGFFLDNFPIGALVIDNEDNIYVVRGDTNRTVFKVTPSGEKTVVGKATATNTRVPVGSTLGPDGQLYVFSANRIIDKVNLGTGEVLDWHRLRTSRFLRAGAFDSNGFLYSCGYKTDIWVINSNDSTSVETTLYPVSGADSIYSIKIYNGYLYVAGGSPAAHFIWRHLIGAGGSLGPQEPVTDLGTFTSNTIRDFALSSEGKIFIATDGPYSVLVYDPSDGSIDYFYKNIVHPYAKNVLWGSGNHIYMVNGNASTVAALTENWTVFRVDMGTTGAP